MGAGPGGPNYRWTFPRLEEGGLVGALGALGAPGVAVKRWVGYQEWGRGWTRSHHYRARAFPVVLLGWRAGPGHTTVAPTFPQASQDLADLELFRFHSSTVLFATSPSAPACDRSFSP